MLYELGIVGALLFLALAFVVVRDGVQVAAPGRAATVDELAAYLPAAWLLALAGGLAGAALFGGIPFAAIFWLTLGIVAVAPALAATVAADDSQRA